MIRTMLCAVFLASALATSLWADAPRARDLYKFDGPKLADPPARRGVDLSLDTFVGFYPRHDELKLGLALVLENGQHLRPELQVADNTIGVGIGYKLPLKIFADALSISIGAGVSWDTSRHEWTGSAYLAKVLF